MSARPRGTDLLPIRRARYCAPDREAFAAARLLSRGIGRDWTAGARARRRAA